MGKDLRVLGVFKLRMICALRTQKTGFGKDLFIYFLFFGEFE